VAAPIYSVRFILAAGGSALELDYLVPAGKVAVIRDICVGSTDGAAGYAVAVAIGGVPVHEAILAAGAGQTDHWDGRAVANAGETIECYKLRAAATCIVSGYLLTAP